MGKTQKVRALPQAVRRKSATRLVVILIFALAGAFLMGSVAKPTLSFIYQQMASRTQTAHPAPDPDTPITLPPKQDHTTGPATTGTATTAVDGGHPSGKKPAPQVATKQTDKTGHAKSGGSDTGSGTVSNEYQFSPGNVIPFALLGALLGSWLGARFLSALERVGLRWDAMEAGDKVTLFVGIFAGLIASVPLLLFFQALPNLDKLAQVVLILAVTLGLSALSVYALQTMSDILPWNRGRGPMRRSGIKILDTNVIIDGRVYDVVKTGFLDGQMYVPGFVLEELQYIADSHDPLRRQRGRRGLETLRHMQSEFSMDVRIHDRLAPDLGDGVDARLVRLAKAIGADIVTNDFNLRRVAELEGLHILSLNDLALSLRPNVLPQETLMLSIVREGNQLGQGVGYLEDGTMVVVENGRAHIGDEVEVIVTQVIQTERGKMIFGEVPPDEGPDAQLARTKRPRPKP